MNVLAQRVAAASPPRQIRTGPGRWFPATELLRAYAAWRGRVLDRQNAVAAQAEQLRKLVAAAVTTRFGRDHDFASIRTVADFQGRVPVRRYDDLWERYWQPAFPHLTDCTWPGTIPYFALSSGTSTGAVKHIPCSRQMIRANKRAALDVLVHHVRNRPASRVFDGQCFLLGGSTDLNEVAPGIRCGDISGIAAAEQPAWVRPFYFPPRELTFLTDWEEKIDRLAMAALRVDIRFISGAPGWLAILFAKMFDLCPEAQGRLAQVFPHLEIITHGGVSFAPYHKRFETLLAGSPAELREVYPASEGFIAIADRAPGQGLRLLADNGIFFEFIPVAELSAARPTRHWLGTVEPGVDYALALSTCAGLWSYLIGDVVQFIDRQPPRLRIVGRVSYMLSAFGEHLTGDLVETAVLAAAATVGLDVAEFTVSTEFDGEHRALGRHVYVVEPVDGAGGRGERVAQDMARVLDRELQARNEDYRERRLIHRGVREPVVRLVPAGTFHAWLKSQGKLGGQNKVPRVIPDGEQFRRLLHVVARVGGAAEAVKQQHS